MALVSAGAEVNEPDQIGCTPLHYAAASQAFSRWVCTARPGRTPAPNASVNTSSCVFPLPRVDRHFPGNHENNEEEAKESYL